MKTLEHQLDWFQNRIQDSRPIEKIGRVVQVTGLIIESEGPEVSLGDVVEVYSHRRDFSVQSEVVGFRDNRVLLMPLGEMKDIHAGCRVISSSITDAVPVGETLKGRVIDGLGNPIDSGAALRSEHVTGVEGRPPNPMKRQRIENIFQTGVKSIDSFIPLGQGQRMGIFAGSGVGKSVLMGMIARYSEADINVISLVGERGRELREFIENDLGPEGLERSIIVVSTSDQPAPLRLRAALMATRIAEYFRDQGQKVLYLMDSVTRLAMAQREIGLAVGEPPTSRGYTPSVFSLLPRLLERAGSGEQGSITALYTVLVEGDDLNDPISDAVRSIVDGHIVLDRELATANHFPAVDILSSVSRLARDLCTEEEVQGISDARDLLSLYRKNEDLINIGAYKKGSNARIDKAIKKHEVLMDFLRQRPHESISRPECMQKLLELLK